MNGAWRRRVRHGRRGFRGGGGGGGGGALGAVAPPPPPFTRIVGVFSDRITLQIELTRRK